MSKKKQPKKTLSPRKGGSVVLDENGKEVSNSNNVKPKTKQEGANNVN